MADAWPAAETEELDGWLLRATGGPSKRSNSVATHEATTTSELTLEARLEHVEAWYATRGQRALLQVGPCAAPSELDQTLANRGYARVGETLVMTAVPSEIAALRVKAAKLETSLGFTPSPAFQALLRESRFAGHEDTLLAVFRNLGTRCRFLVVRDLRGVPLGSCVGIASEDRLGIYALLTLPEARRRGVARTMLQSLAQSALAESMRELYLQVESENAPALALCEQAGFREFYRYHYRAHDASTHVAHV